MSTLYTANKVTVSGQDNNQRSKPIEYQQKKHSANKAANYKANNITATRFGL